MLRMGKLLAPMAASSILEGGEPGAWRPPAPPPASWLLLLLPEAPKPLTWPFSSSCSDCAVLCECVCVRVCVCVKVVYRVHVCG
jgi:hypothetical protein